MYASFSLLLLLVPQLLDILSPVDSLVPLVWPAQKVAGETRKAVVVKSDKMTPDVDGTLLEGYLRLGADGQNEVSIAAFHMVLMKFMFISRITALV